MVPNFSLGVNRRCKRKRKGVTVMEGDERPEAGEERTFDYGFGFEVDYDCWCSLRHMNRV